MSNLLPPNTTLLERIAAEVGSTATELPVIIRELWNPETCPEHLLAWLAWAWSVDSWREDWSERQKRNAIASSIEVHRTKGTIGAVRAGLGAVGIPIRIQEWFNQTPPAEPFTFRVLLDVDQTGVPHHALGQAIKIINQLKNVRSHLEQVTVTATSRSAVTASTATNVGNEVTLSRFKPALLIPNGQAIVVG